MKGWLSPSRGRPDERPWLALGLIVLTAIGLRILFASLPRVVRWDEAAYQLIARNLLAGRGYSELVGARDLQQPPMVAYLSVFGLVLRLPVEWATAAFTHILLGGLLVLPVYGLGRGIYNPRVGLIAALFVAVYPALAVSPLYWSTMTEPAYLLYVMVGIYATWRITQARTGGWGWAALMGLAFGMAYLTRPEALAYLAVMAVYIVAWRWRDGRRLHPSAGAVSLIADRRLSSSGHRADGSGQPASVFQPLLLAGLAGVVFLLCATPYVIYMHRVTGRWALSGKQGITMGIAWAYVNHDQAEHDRVVASLDSAGQEIMWLSSDQYDQSLIGWIAKNPQRFVWQVRRNLDETWQALFQQDLFRPWFVALMVLGLFARPWMRRRLRAESLLILALAPLISLWAFFVLSRFLMIVVPIGLMWAAAGVDHLAGWAEATAHNLRSGDGQASVLARAAPLAAVVVLLLWGCFAVVRSELPQQPFWRLETARWLADNVPAGSNVMMRSSEVPLYAGLPMVAFPNAPWPQVLDYARRHEARYLVVEDAEIADIRPQLKALVEPASLQPLDGVRWIARLPDPTRTTYIYEFEAEP